MAGHTRWLAIGVLALGACGSKAEAPPEPIAAPVDASVARGWPDAREVVGNLASRTAGMALVPAGPYHSPTLETWPTDDQLVDVPEFYIDRLEVTVADYRRCVDAKRCTAPVVSEFCTDQQLNWAFPERDQHPVNCIREVDAAAHCHFRGVHLPTTWQWAKAARGTDPRRHPWGDEPPTCKLAVIASNGAAEQGCGRGGTWPVGSRPAGASPYGVLDLIGNVEEFATIDQDPVDPTDVEWLRVSTTSRGGSFESPSRETRLTVFSRGTGIESAVTGFRCAFQPSASLERRR